MYTLVDVQKGPLRDPNLIIMILIAMGQVKKFFIAHGVHKYRINLLHQMKKGSKLVSTLIGTSMVVAPTISGFSQDHYEAKVPIKESTIVSTNVVPVKTLKKTIDYSTMKPVKELQTETVSYMDRNEGIQMGYVYVPVEDKMYDKPSSEIIRESNREVTSFEGEGYLNTYIQHYWTQGGDFHLNYYGSGDMDEDNKYTLNDRNLILNSTDDKADTDLDGNPGTPNDVLTYEMFYTDQIPRLPIHYEYHQTPAEKINAIEKVLAIDQTNTHPPGPNWTCHQYTFQTEFNTDGVWNLSGAPLNWGVYDSTMNGKFNIPIYQVSTKYQNGEAHAINAILIDTNITDLAGSWYAFEPQTDQRQYGGDPSLNDYANIKKYAYFWSEYVGDYVYSLEPIINFDLDGNGQQISYSIPNSNVITSQPIELTSVQENIGGLMPSDTAVNFEEGTNPSVTGIVTGIADWATASRSDSTTQAGTVADSIYYNYTVFGSWVGISDSNGVINDTTYGHINPIYNRPAQLITVQDTTSTTTGNPGTINLPFTGWPDGIPAPSGWDECGYWTTTRTLDSTNRIANPILCEYYDFTEWYTDQTVDPSGNSSSESFEVNVSLDNHYWTYFPYDWTLYYDDEQIPANTGGVATAENPVPEISVIADQNPPIINSTYSPDSLSSFHYNASYDILQNSADTVCYDTIDGLQHITIYKPNALVCTDFPENPLTIGKDDIVGPPFTGEPTYMDTLETWWPTYYDHSVEFISATPTDSTFHVHFVGKENITGTQTPDSVQVVIKDLDIKINENGLEKRTRNLFTPYPNPTHSGKINVKINSTLPGVRNIYVKVYNLNGVLLDHYKDEIYAGRNKLEIDLSGRQNGVYLIHLRYTDIVYVWEIIKN